MNKRFDVIDLPIKDLKLLQRKVIGDTRGYLERMFCFNELQKLLTGKNIIQINHTLTAKIGAVRGMHFQHPPHTETKIVSCLRGEVFDVVVDIRSDSASFLKWHGEILSEENHRTLLIPDGFAHGFQTLTKDCELLYFHTAAYNQDAEDGLNPEDPILAINWPLPISERSARDTAHPPITDDFRGVAI